MQRTGFKPRQAGLARSTGLARQQPLRQVSQKQRAGKAAQGRAYAAADDEREWCSVCGKPGPTDHAHLYTQHQREDLKNDARNWIIIGRYCECHRLQENNKAEFARRYPEAWRRILWQMEVLDPVAFPAFRLKNPF